MTTPTLLFDLGGVVVPWVGFEAVAGLTGFDREEIDQRFEDEAALYDYGIGRSSTHDFCEALPRVMELDIAPAAVPTLWNSWVLPPFPGVVEAITRLKATHRTACLSNTNALHWDHIGRMFDVDALFEVPLASHLMQLAKPDPAIYRAAAEQLETDPADIHFFEDTARNIEAAREAGYTVHAVDRARGVLPVLERLGLVG